MRKARQLAVAFTAGLLLAASTGVEAQAQEGKAQDDIEAQATPLGDASLRASQSLDRSGPKAANSSELGAPYSISSNERLRDPGGQNMQGKTDQASSAPRDPANKREDEDENPTKSRKPRFDLFEGPSKTGSRRENAAAEPALPSIGVPSASRRAADPAKRRKSRGSDALLRRANLESGGTDRGERLRDRQLPDSLRLPSAPVRPTRIDPVTGRGNLPATPLRSVFPIVSDDPFAPVGIRLGRFDLYATVDQSAGYSSNLGETPAGRGGAFSDTTLSTRILSDWSTHQAEMNVIADYQRNFAGESKSDPDVRADGRLRLDVDRSTTATLRGAFQYRREDADDLDAVDGASERPDLLDYSTSAAIEHAFGEVLGRATVSAVRETTSDRGAEGSARSEDFNTYTSALRVGYEVSPTFTPFVEGSLGRRVFDDDRDLAGIERDSTIEAIRGGLAFNFGEKLGGEIAGGYAANVPDASQIDTVGSPTVDARLAWSPQRGTDLALTASTTFDPSTSGLATATLYEAGLAVRHRATARTELNAALTAGYRDSQIDADRLKTWGIDAGFLYWINRSIAFTGLARHEEVDRSRQVRDYDVDSIQLGIRLQN